ncbi:hypothetical protein L5515_012807 [Caenorhabditis briggsae]|uniref:7TM GPCR serpentine receptor class x (Srx) domain-containing protein n=1 Tax=Caenorhabditis briggsae TaxID=6238 RepID=A0AAE9EYM7_CAEBR|nr:hypothetical protein L5515_012807 [Caenorhabditis briggsae]
MPTKVTNLFNYRNTCFIILFVWSMGFGHMAPYFWRDTCYMVYDPVSWTWVFGDTPCTYVISTFTDNYSSIAIFVVMSTLDLSTFVMLVLYRRKSHLTSDSETRRRRRVEIRFFTQSCLQGIIFFYEVFNFYYIVTLNTNQWFVFMTSTIAWELCHCLDGSWRLGDGLESYHLGWVAGQSDQRHLTKGASIEDLGNVEGWGGFDVSPYEDVPTLDRKGLGLHAVQPLHPMVLHSFPWSLPQRHCIFSAPGNALTVICFFYTL